MKTQFGTGSSAPKPVKVEQVLTSVETGIRSLDGDRAAAYAGLIPLRAAKQHALLRREKLFSVKYGANDPRVGFAGKARQNNLQLQRELVVVQAAAATPTPTLGAREYVLHGYVRNSRGEPVPNVTVALYDQSDHWVRPQSGGPTDQKGYFELHFEITARSETGAAGEKAREKLAQKLEKAMSQGQGAGSIRGERLLQVDEIRVYDANQKLLHQDATPIRPRGGVSDYREIVIGDGESAVIAVPPEQAKPAAAPAAAHPGKPEKKKPAKAAKPKPSSAPATKKKSSDQKYPGAKPK